MPTNVFTPTDAIRLDNFMDNGTTASWTGGSSTSTSSSVVDWNDDGNLDSTPGAPPGGGASRADYFSSTGITYTGYTIDLGGNTYAIFASGSLAFIPYDSGVQNLSTFDFSTITSTTDKLEDGTAANFCFVDGTMISTPNGETAVEDLKIGDLIKTESGDAVPVKWVGVQKVASVSNVAFDERRAPVCISKDTLGNHSDLVVSADHGMIVDGYVINASALVNGGNVSFVPVSELPSGFTYFHIETENHDVILANGAASETFIDAAGRAAFDNHQEYLDLYGVERIIPEMEMPRISSARLVPQAIKDRLAGRSNTGFAQTA